MNKLAAQIEQMTPDQFYQFVTVLCKAYLDPIHAAGACYCRECIFARERYGKLECINGISYRNTYNEPNMFCSYGEPKEAEE